MGQTASKDVVQQQLPPFLSTVNAANIVPTKLCFSSTGTNYQSWKEHVLCVIQSQGLLGFIDGPPRETDTDNLWRRTDMLLRGWILSSLNDDVVSWVSHLNTSRDVWLGLQSISQPFFNFPPATTDPTPEAGEDKMEEDSDYLPLDRAALRGDWETAKIILDHRPGSGIINLIKSDILITAAGSGKSNRFVEELIKELPYECIIPEKKSGDTALTTAVSFGNINLAISLATKMPELLYIPKDTGEFPIQIAAVLAGREMLEYLISVTKSDNDFGANPYTGYPGLRLLLCVIEAEFFDIALSLVEKYPELARLTLPDDKSSALLRISSKKSVFCSESRFTFWERFMSSRVSLDTTLRPQFTTGSDIESITPNGQAVFQRLHVMLWKFVDRLGLTKSIKENKLLKRQALKLVKCLCKEIESSVFVKAKDIYFDACVVAAALGIHEVVEEILQVFPSALYCSTRESKQYLLHVAVENRSEHVYILLCQKMGDYMRYFSVLGDSDANNPLHLAGKLAPSQKLDEISGAALQMQYEMQWYKELENLFNPLSKELLNSAGKSPKTVFTEEHKRLKEEGEKWMKDTANSCTIAAALIATVMFAAAITVPGGTDSSNGFPIFSSNAAFIVFAISDAVSLFTSATSLLMFLAILTSRYAEEDFLRVLPKRLIIGLGALFLSITFMMVAFSATIYLVFGQKKAWVLIPVGGLACLPVASFVLLQFPLLYDLISSTYGPGMFPKQRNRTRQRL